MQATNTMPSMPTVHKTTKQAIAKNSLTNKTEPFSSEFKQVLLQAQGQEEVSTEGELSEQIGESEASQMEKDLELLLEVDQLEETKAEDQSEEEVHPETAALFLQPLAEAEQEMQFSIVLEKGTKMDGEKQVLAAKQQTANVQVELVNWRENSLPENQQLKTISFVKESLQQTDKQEKILIPTELSTDTSMDELKTKMESFMEKSSQMNERVMTEPKAIYPSSISEKSVEILPSAVSTQVIEHEEMNDLDIQSDLRLRISLPKAEGTQLDKVEIQPQTAMSKEQNFSVVLDSEQPVANQQKLSQKISDMMTQEIKTMQNGQSTTARLSLAPETLGNISIEIRMEDNQLKTTIVVESAEVKELLDNGMQQLTQSLAQKNIQLQETTVHWNAPQEMNFTFAESSTSQEQQQENKQPMIHSEMMEEVVNQSAAEETTIADGRVSILA